MTLDECIGNIKEYDLIYILRDKNEMVWRKYALLDDDRDEIIRGLSHGDYCYGPELNYDSNKGEVWIFKKYISKYNYEFYIKITMKDDKRKCIVISLH
ncbi:Uncharacterised protein [Haploplasma axanthum]|uniref:DUF4258 domain-containing protein n=1 Tax=Haploplasma axanthum TaxID=29552 RepID=A0A449BFU6_HAPAX|nr:Uncharacterised protein [Haploplasma axanthum]